MEKSGIFWIAVQLILIVSIYSIDAQGSIAPQNQYLFAVGESVSIPCTISSSLSEFTASISWVKLSDETANAFNGSSNCSESSSSGSGAGGSGDILTPVSDLTLLLQNESVASNGSDLNFTAISFGDEGLYVCTVRSMDTIECYSEAITIAVAPQVMVSSNETYNQGDNAVINCSSLGGPRNIFQWSVNGSDINGETSSRLDLSNVNASTGGEYSCFVNNIAGNDTASSFLFIFPYIISPPVDTQDFNGSMITLMCEAEGFPSPQYQWRHANGTGIRNDIIGQNTTMLVFSPLLFGDEGSYFCNVTSGENTISQNVTITIAPQVMVSANQTYNQGDNAVINCSSLGGPRNVFQWSVNGSDINGETSPRLDLSNVNASTGGEYRCFVNNIAGNDTASSFLFIFPYIISPPVDTRGSNGSMITLMCVAEGFPPPQYQWRHANGTGIRNDIIGQNSTMLGFSPLLFGDEGSYFCNVTSGENTISQNVTITIAPQVMVSANETYNQGENAVINCSSLGGPRNVFQWSVNGSDINGETSSRLDLSNVSASTGGEYSCFVNNIAGNDTASSFLFIFPYIISPPVDTQDFNGSMITLMCEAEGFPPPQYQWRHANGTQISDIIGQNSTMLVFSPLLFGDEGSYFCNVTSGENTISQNVTITIAPQVMVSANQTYNQGDNAVINCSSLGGPRNVFQWSVNGSDINGEISSRLDLSNVSASTGGEYSCFVNNIAGNDTASSFLFIFPYIISPPVDTRGSNGSMITLMCEAEGFPSPQYQWRHANGTEIRNDITGQNSTMLVFSPLLFGDEGSYFCNVTSGENTISQNVTITIAPQVMVSANQTYNQGENAVINCSSLGGPRNVFQWSVNGSDINGETSSQLDLSNVNASTGGEYSCFVNNIAGNDTASSFLFIFPYIISPPVDTQGSNGSMITLMCVAEGFPFPQYQWRHANGTEISDIIGQNSTMLVFSPLLFGDEGSYFCNVTSGENTISQNVTITISPFNGVSVNPNITNSIIGDVVEVTCRTRGGPDNSFSYIRLSDETELGTVPTINITINSALDGGQHECRVSNLAGNDTASLTINVFPVISENPENINVTSFEGTIALTCNATGFPIPSIIWYQNGTALSDGQDNRTSITSVSMNTSQNRFISSSLTISMAMVNNSGDYHCNVSSPAFDNDVMSDVALVLVQDRPEQPQNVTAVNITSRTIGLTWVEPHDNNAPIQGYQVMYMEPEFVEGERRRIVNTSIEMAAITDLFPGVDYTFTVTAFNDIGPSTPSDPLTVRTLDEAPNSPPENVSILVLTSTMIMGSWESVPPESRNGNITMYEVLYQPLDGAIMTQTMNVSGSVMTVVLMELEEFVNYNISVRAYTSQGAGPYSEEVTVMTLEDIPASPPDNVTALANSSTTIVVTWDIVPPINQNGIITMYDVLYQPLETFDGAIMTQTMNVSGSVMTVVLMELEEFVNYNISVRAYTSQGAGPYSEEVTVMTLEDIPASPPDNVTALANSSTTIVVTWDIVPPIDQNGIITMYEVLYHPLETFDGAIMTQTMNVTDMSANLINLEEFVNYNISVRAYTSQGAGPYSVAMTIQTLEDEPATSPVNVMATATSSRSISVMWKNVLEIDQNGIITMYEVLYQPLETFDDGDIMTQTMNVSGSVMTVVLMELQEFVNYNISVRANTSQGAGPYSEEVTVMTLEDIPGPVSKPPEVQNNTLTSMSALLEWNDPIDPNGIIIGYRIIITALSTDPISYNSMTMMLPGDRRKRQVSGNFNCITMLGNQVEMNRTLDENRTSYNVSNLTPYTVYQFTVQARTSRGFGNFSSPRQFITPENVSTRVTNFKLTATSSTSIDVTWNPPTCPYGNVTEYVVSNRRVDASNAEYSSFTVLSVMGMNLYRITNLIPYTNYTVRVQAIVTPFIRTGMKIPGEIVEDLQERTLSAPDADIPSLPPTTKPTNGPTSSQITILIGDPRQIDTGKVIFVAVVVVIGPVTQVQDNKALYNDARAYISSASPPLTYYIAAAWDVGTLGSIPSSFSVGGRNNEGSTHKATPPGQRDVVTYNNIPLRSNTEYSIFVRYDIENENLGGSFEPHQTFSEYTFNKTRLPYSEGGLAAGLIIIIILITVVVIAIVILLYLYKRKKFGKFIPNKRGHSAIRNENAWDNSEKKEMEDIGFYPNPIADLTHAGTVDPVSIEDFSDHVRHLHANDNYLFTEEYSLLEPDHHPTTEYSRRPENIHKNRYANITAYDASRVKLEEISPAPGSDYINANYIDGYQMKDFFIATQGPVPGSVPDFWRMVWEKGSATIIMLTNCEEKGRVKCHKYWPDELNRPVLHNNFKVTLQDSLVLAAYTVRTFSLQQQGSKNERVVRQFHFTIWPDHGVPDEPSPLLHFIQKVTQNNPPNSGPMVVHCSAGVGRTGTFITIHSQLLRIKREKNTSIFSFVQNMRSRRCFMVQTEAQYVFLHDALLEYIECGVTEVPARDLASHYKSLNMVDTDTGETRIDLEFLKLASTIHDQQMKTNASMPSNRTKNRVNDVTMLPYDKNRTRLTSIPGIQGSDYINASHIDGYHHCNAFIATQAPLPDTTSDFWRMIWEQKCATIVMLTREREGGKSRCFKYWPEGGAIQYSYLQIIAHDFHDYGDYSVREITIVNAKPEDMSSHNVRLFQYIDWPEEPGAVPSTSTGLIDVIGQVQKWQISSGNKPIVVHCSGGTGRTGTFIAVSILLERLKTEGVVDVFHTVRALRLQRPGMVQTVPQYNFCYKTVIEFLQSFEHYSNFK